MDDVVFDYIMYDVDKIKDYVFESFKPREVAGASEIIKCLDYDPETKEKEKKEEDGEVIQEIMENTEILKEGDIIYSRGGGGLLRTKRQHTEKLCDLLEKEYAKFTKSGSLTTVSLPVSDNFASDCTVLAMKIRQRKAIKLLEKPMDTVVFTEQNKRCQVCGKRPSDPKLTRKWEDEEILYCPICDYKRQYKPKGTDGDDTNQAISMEDIIKPDKENNPRLKNLKDTKDILVIYGDLNDAGSHLADITNENQLKAFSNGVFEVLRDTRETIKQKLKDEGFQYLTPVAGGDDLIIFTHPASFHLIKDQLFQIEFQLQKRLNKEIKMNFSFIMAKHNFPINHLFGMSEELLKLSKDRYYQDPDKNTYYGFFQLWEGGNPPAEENIYSKKEFENLFVTAQKIKGEKEINRSALFTILELIKEPGAQEKELLEAERELNLEYFIPRYKNLGDYIFRENGEYLLKTKDTKRILDARTWEDLILMENLFYEVPNEK